MATPESKLLGQVYARAAIIITERGWAPEYTYRSGAPVDLSRAISLAEKDLKYPTSQPYPGDLLGEWTGKTPSALSRKFDQEDALSLLEDAMLAADDILAGVKLPPPEEIE